MAPPPRAIPHPPPLLTAVLLACLLGAGGPAPARAQGHFALASRNGLDAWAVGDSGRWYRTFDGGATWGAGTLGHLPLRAVAARGWNVVIAGDSGRVWRSRDLGGTWSLDTVQGAPTLRAIDLSDDSTGLLVGDAGTVVRVAMRGPLRAPPSGLTGGLAAVRCVDGSRAWVAGANGLVARTVDAGGHWSTPAPFTGEDLTGIDAAGGRVWAVGANAVAFRSTDDGATFARVDLGLDAHCEVRAVHLAGADTVWLAGGGGFLRRSSDGGANWTWPVHPLQGAIGAIAFAGPRAFACSTRQPIVIASPDRGATWFLPTGAEVSHAWSPRLTFTPGQVQSRGRTLAADPARPGGFYFLLGFADGSARLYHSLDAGERWATLGPPIPDATRANVFLVSPRDSNLMFAAVREPARVIRSLDGGQSWSTVLTHRFGEFGSPLAMDPDHPDTLFFAGDSLGVLRSTDAGATWTAWGSTVFEEPCDIVVVPGRDSVLLLTDAVEGTGGARVWRSADFGANWTLQASGGASTREMPAIAVSRLAPERAFVTAWDGGGVLRSSDLGRNWSPVSPAVPPWGVAIGRDDPNMVVVGLFGSSIGWFSFDGGDHWMYAPFSGANFSLLARDRDLVLAQQSNGVYRLQNRCTFTPSNAQALALTAPRGGETWNPGDVRTIAWSPAGVALVRLAYRTDPAGPWRPIADVPADAGGYDWIVPPVASAHAEIRASDAWDDEPADSTRVPFTISTVGLVPENGLALAAPQPSPFHDRTTIVYTLREAAHVRLEILDVRGARRGVLVDADRGAGTHAEVLDRAALGANGHAAAGVYFARLTSRGRVATRKLLYLP